MLQLQESLSSLSFKKSAAAAAAATATTTTSLVFFNWITFLELVQVILLIAVASFTEVGYRSWFPTNCCLALKE